MAAVKRKPKEFNWCAVLDKAFHTRFNQKVTTTFNPIIGSCVTKLNNGKKMTPEQYAYIDGFMDRHGATD